MKMAIMLTGVIGLVWSATAAEHPRLLVDKTQIQEIRRRCQQEPYASMEKQIKAQLLTDKPAEGKSLMNDNRLPNYAALYLLTGQKQYATEAEKLVVDIVNDTLFWNNPGSKGLTRAAGALRVALAYDACYDAWTDANRTLVSQKLLYAAENIMKSMGAGANNGKANNWQAVRYGSAGMAFLACDEPGGAEKVKDAYNQLKQHLNANLGDNGWNPEGIGYTQYPWGFTGPFGIAAARAGIGDLRKDIPKAARTFWTTYVGTVSISGAGLRADLGDDHPAWSGDGTAGMAFYYAPAEQLPGLRWMYDYLCGANGNKTFDTQNGGGLYSVMYYPMDVPAKNPAQVAGLGLNYTDKSHGIAIFRNKFQDENDIAFLVNGHSRQPQGCHGGPDVNSIRLLGLGSAWIVGSGRTGDANGQSNLFPGAPAKKPAGGLGHLTKADFQADGGGVAITTGSCMGTLNHKRVSAVDYSGKTGAAAVFVTAETSDNGALWRLNTPEFNTLTTQGNQFTLTGPNGSTLVGTVIEPAKPEFRTGTFERGGGAGHVGYPFQGKKHINNKWLEFNCDKNVLVVFTLQERGKPAPRVQGTGTASKASLKIGMTSAEVDGDAITLAIK